MFRVVCISLCEPILMPHLSAHTSLIIKTQEPLHEIAHFFGGGGVIVKLPTYSNFLFEHDVKYSLPDLHCCTVHIVSISSLLSQHMHFITL
jgi:hypothetical protein